MTLPTTQPPSYSGKEAAQPPAYTPNDDVPQPASSSTQAPITSPFSTTDSYGFYRNFASDILMAQHAADPPAFYVALNKPRQPDICLHAGATNAGPIIGTADHGNSSTLVNLAPEPSGRAAPGTAFETAERGESIWELQFRVFVEPTGEVETFEWTRSSGDDVKALGGLSTGGKCVRSSTDETVAVMAGVLSWKKVAKMKYLGTQKGALGARAEMMLLMSVLGIIAPPTTPATTTARKRKPYYRR